MPKIAISYRRTDSDITGRIFDRLVKHYGQDSVFRDIDSIPFGIDFRKVINDALQDADALVAIVGPTWSGGERQDSARINKENDLVRIEIETALQRGIPLIPVLVGGALMPEAAELPASLCDFPYYNAANIDSGRNFDTHVERLVRSMDALFEGKLADMGAGQQSAAKHFPGVHKPVGVPIDEPAPVHSAAVPVRAQAPDLSRGTSEPTTDEGFVYVHKPKKGPTLELRLVRDALEFTDGQGEGRIFYDQILAVLLKYKQVKKRRVFSTSIWSREGMTLHIDSVSFEEGREEYKDGAYGRFIRELHRRTERAGAQASFRVGSTITAFLGNVIVIALFAIVGISLMIAGKDPVWSILGVGLTALGLGGSFELLKERPRRYRPNAVPDGFVPRGY